MSPFGTSGPEQPPSDWRPHTGPGFGRKGRMRRASSEKSHCWDPCLHPAPPPPSSGPQLQPSCCSPPAPHAWICFLFETVGRSIRVSTQTDNEMEEFRTTTTTTLMLILGCSLFLPDYLIVTENFIWWQVTTASKFYISHHQTCLIGRTVTKSSFLKKTYEIFRLSEADTLNLQHFTSVCESLHRLSGAVCVCV